MPKVTSYTPAWLSKPSPGHSIFAQALIKAEETNTAQLNRKTKRSANSGPRRTIARRGTEVFIAVGREIRWADLVYLKEAWEDGQRKHPKKSEAGEQRESQYAEDHAQGFRTIKTPVADDIRQLVISPNSNYLAIITTHTIHIAVLPEPSHLTAPDTGPMRPKTYTLGPTTHVTSRSPISSALWHPLGVNGSCLVTVTEDAVVRVWELSFASRLSFDQPGLAIDLKKLADGTSVDQDFNASVSGTNKGFSPDSFDMEVASACFASGGSGGWSPMTLWIAMKEGDIYALCPLLPEKWSPTPTLIPSLSISIVAKVAAMEDDPEISHKSKLLAQQQLAWMSDLDMQEPMYIESPAGDPATEIYTRPAKPGRIPKLQGPFQFDLAPEESENEVDTLLTDIYVIGPKIDTDELMLGEDDDLEMDEVDQEGLSLGLVCLLTSGGRLSICLDLNGVEAQWLPKSKSKTLRAMGESIEPPTILVFQTLETLYHDEIWEGNWPMFSQDVNSRYSFYITDRKNVTFISVSPWVFRLETELAEGAAGTDFRLDLLVKSQSSERERIYSQTADASLTTLAASSLIRDPDLGYFLLTTTPHGPIAVVFESPEFDFDPYQRDRSPTFEEAAEKPLLLCQPRPVYEPSHALESNSSLPSLLDKLRHSKYRRMLSEDVRLSPATLTLMTDAHKLLSEETHRIGTAAAELFRRCELLQIELQAQIKKANDVAGRVDAVIGDDSEGGLSEGNNEIIEKRVNIAQAKQKELAERLEKIRRKAAKGTTRELSDKERAWIEEVELVQRKIVGEGELSEASVSSKSAQEPWERYELVSNLQAELLAQVQNLDGAEKTGCAGSVLVSSEEREAKAQQIQKLLERESALVDGTKSRLERLSLY